MRAACRIHMSNATQTVYDLAVVGGGINGTGIARDAAGRGLKVVLLEKDDLTGAGGLKWWSPCLLSRADCRAAKPSTASILSR